MKLTQQMITVHANADGGKGIHLSVPLRTSVAETGRVAWFCFGALAFFACVPAICIAGVYGVVPMATYSCLRTDRRPRKD